MNMLGPPGVERRSVGRDLANAPDERVLEVVRFVEGLPDRGPVDGLLAPLRGRLRGLRPPRPLRFARLMFLPIEPAIVEARDWRAGEPMLPRTAIAPLAGVVERVRPDLVAHVQCVAADPALLDTERVGLAGRSLWPAAAEALEAPHHRPAGRRTACRRRRSRRWWPAVSCACAPRSSLRGWVIRAFRPTR